jgi:nucleotide-binding universal stress UspA family protein
LERRRRRSAAARDCDADLLVIGGCGHALWREMLFGGASRQILATAGCRS